MLRRWGSENEYLVSSTGLIWLYGHRKEIREMAFRALALRQSELAIARNVSSGISLRWPYYVINSVDKTKYLFHNLQLAKWVSKNLVTQGRSISAAREWRESTDFKFWKVNITFRKPSSSVSNDLCSYVSWPRVLPTLNIGTIGNPC